MRGYGVPFVIINPTSGGGRAGRLWPKVAKELKKHIGAFHYEKTSEVGHARLLAQHATSAGHSPIIAYGGDGTIHEVVNGMIDAEKKPCPKLGILNVGTGGDFVKSLGFPKSLKEQIQILEEGKSTNVDLGQVDYTNGHGKTERRVFVNITDAGVGGLVVRHVQGIHKIFGRKLAYLVSTVRSYLSWKACDIEIETESTEILEKTIAVVIANGKFFGGGMPIAPKADLSDGYFEIIKIQSMNPFYIPFFLAFLYAGQLIRLPHVQSDRVKKMTLRSKNSVPLDIDGEPIGFLPATFTILPQQLQVISK